MEQKITSSPFSRGISPCFVDQLNKMYDERGSWWREFVDDKDLFLAIRNNFVNIYYHGNSLMKLEWNKGDVFGEVHYKYLLKPRKKSEYITINTIDGKVCLPETTCLFIDDLIRVGDIKKASEPYAGPEKEGVHDIILANPNILDIDWTFAKSPIPG